MPDLPPLLWGILAVLAVGGLGALVAFGVGCMQCGGDEVPDGE